MNKLMAWEKALILLREHRMVSNAMFVNGGVGFRYANSISKLRSLGHDIEKIKPADGPTPAHKNTWWYQLVYDAECCCADKGPLFCPIVGHLDTEVGRAEADAELRRDMEDF